MTEKEKRMLTLIGEQLARIIDLEAQLARADEIITTGVKKLPRAKK